MIFRGHCILWIFVERKNGCVYAAYDWIPSCAYGSLCVFISGIPCGTDRTYIFWLVLCDSYAFLCVSDTYVPGDVIHVHIVWGC